MPTATNPASKTKTLYKGDVWAGRFYWLLGMVSIVSALTLYKFTSRLGLFYLSIGMAVFSVYLIGKGTVMAYHYYSRYKYYLYHTELNSKEISEERRYSRFRVLKKKKNRRAYIYTMLLTVAISLAGLFHQEKGMILATCITIFLMALTEFVIGIMTEFRLKEYLKHLHSLSQLLF